MRLSCYGGYLSAVVTSWKHFPIGDLNSNQQCQFSSRKAVCCDEIQGHPLAPDQACIFRLLTKPCCSCSKSSQVFEPFRFFHLSISCAYCVAFLRVATKLARLISGLRRSSIPGCRTNVRELIEVLYVRVECTQRITAS